MDKDDLAPDQDKNPMMMLFAKILVYGIVGIFSILPFFLMWQGGQNWALGERSKNWPSTNGTVQVSEWIRVGSSGNHEPHIIYKYTVDDHRSTLLMLVLVLGTGLFGWGGLFMIFWSGRSNTEKSI